VREELLTPEAVADDEAVDEIGLRPRRLNEFVGQGELKEHLGVPAPETPPNLFG
jgi:Holliday junction resolvasome RuvABC ATP-dependent DNA helicase subunit